AALTQDDVRRLDVAMDEALFVRFLQRAADLDEDLHDAVDRLTTVAGHELFEIDATAEVLHRVIEHAVAVAVVEHCDGVRMRELARDPDFLFEPREVVGADAIGAQELDRGRPSQQHVICEMDLAEAAFTDAAHELVLTELLHLADLAA